MSYISLDASFWTTPASTFQAAAVILVEFTTGIVNHVGAT